MTNRPIPSNLPECDLIRVLAEKVAQRNDIKFDFIGKLNDFRERVSGEVRQINLLFPEYTPHDEEYHLSRLFHIASIVLGRDQIEAMNSSELFILALALYGHDWGMAVNEAEKDFIITGKPVKDGENLSILSDEKQRFAKFLKKQGLKIDNGSNNISNEDWREYIRQTHAVRSGERVRRFFAYIDGGVADAAARVCVGHWLNFEDLEDYHLYPPDFSVLQESVNLRALSVYLRLIDLLDLSEDRTPYVIWKFVAPRDTRSKMEWSKHRSLHSITSRPYQDGRVIQVDGSTDDNDVYAALEDLRIWCEGQLRGCNDVLARLNDPRHKLDIYHIDWRVAPNGFKPISIQFEFDRERMFEILGDEIYQSDPYVFLRELLQNSIDAIRVRREVLRKNGLNSEDLGVIKVDVVHGENGNSVITWTDDGIGMDEYVVRNYFSVAGKSYYRSPDFEREGLNIDPISRFGIGFLSCFMVADHVEIQTFRDPYMPPPGEPLLIKIPAIERQFHIEVGIRETVNIGTTITIFVDGKKLPDKGDKNIDNRLRITEYLSIVAGFVEFPIVINEGESKTIILHPKHNAISAQTRFGQEYHVHQLDLKYPLSDIIFPQDLSVAQNLLDIISFDFEDIDLNGYEGSISYLFPKSNIRDFASIYQSEIRGIFIGSNKINIRWSDKWMSYHTPEKRQLGISRSSSHSPTFRVYRDGILIATASTPKLYSSFDLPSPILNVNLPKTKTSRLDLARTEILENEDHWSTPISDQISKHLNLESIFEMEPNERLYQLARCSICHPVSKKTLWKLAPKEKWPLPILESEGNIVVTEWGKMMGNPIFMSPSELDLELLNTIKTNLINLKKKNNLPYWNGNTSLVKNIFYTSGNEVLQHLMLLWREPLNSYRLSSVFFLESPKADSIPMIQEKWMPMDISDENVTIDNLINNAIQNPVKMTIHEKSIFHRIVVRKFFEDYERSTEDPTRDYDLYPIFVTFASPFNNYFGYGCSIYNWEHPVTQELIKIMASLKQTEANKKFAADKTGKLKDLIRSLKPVHSYMSGESVLNYKDFIRDLDKIFAISSELGINKTSKFVLPTAKDFIQHSIQIIKGKKVLVSPGQLSHRQIGKKFGKAISKL